MTTITLLSRLALPSDDYHAAAVSSALCMMSLNNALAQCRDERNHGDTVPREINHCSLRA